MPFEAEPVQEHHSKDTPVEAYGCDWVVEDYDSRNGRYTLKYEHWSIKGVESILVRRRY